MCSPCALFLPTCLVLPLALRKQLYHGSSVYWSLQTPQTFSGKRGCDSLPHIYTTLGFLGDLGDAICRSHANRTPFCRRNISIQISVPRFLLESVIHRYQGMPKRSFNNLIHTIFVTLVLYKSTHFWYCCVYRLSKLQSMQVKSQS